MEEKKVFKIKTLFFMIKCILRASPILFPLMVILTIGSIGISAYSLFVLKDATNGIISLLNLDTTLKQAMFLVFLYIGLELVVSPIISFTIDFIERYYYKEADRYFRLLLLYKLGKLPQENMYNSEIYNKYEFTYRYLYMFQQLPWHLISFIINFSFSKLLYLGIIFTFNIYLGIYCLVLFIFNIVSSILITKQQAKVDKEQVLPTRERDNYANLLTSKEAIRETKINRLEKYFFRKYIDLYYSIVNKQFKVKSRDTWVSQTISFFNFLFNMGLGFFLLLMVYEKSIDVGEMFLILAAGEQIINVAYQFQRPAKYLVQFVSYAPTMIEMLYPLTKKDRRELVETDYPPFGLLLGDFESIVLDNVSYKYPSKTNDAVSNISLTIKKGEIISILGYNGSGKTTTCKLICGVLAPSSGNVYFNNANINQVDQKEYIKYFGIGFQDYAKYYLSLKDNIGFGKIEDINSSDLIFDAIKKTNLQNIIDRLPDGIDTILGKEYDKNGQDLSGGQWQRVILARAYMGSPEILILDEPTASIDPFEEERMLDQFRDSLKNKTAILISHRISFARLADKIVMMKDGKIVEMGSHQELVKKKGYYFDLFSSQQQLYQSEVKTNE